LPRDQGFGLGLGFEDADKVVITAIGKDTPAMRSGRLHLGDRVAAINGQPVSSTTDQSRALEGRHH
jgi:C-terminal processing protease CtpA/Prc